MGYHIVIDPEAFPMRYTYVERIEDLVMVDGINEKSIIFQGNADNPPQQVGTSSRFLYLREDWYRAGLLAHVIFVKLAHCRKLILEELSQDQEHFRAYVKTIKGPVKRGDFLVRNRGNIEIEVKCRSFYGRTHPYFLFSEEDLNKHLNMEKVTKTPIVIAVFQRKEDKPVEASLCMITVDRVVELLPQLVREQKEYGWVYRIPLKETFPGFDLLGEYGLEEQEDFMDVVQRGHVLYTDMEEKPYVLVTYYKNEQHLEWVISSGLYNLRMGSTRGAFAIGKEEAGAKYILLHTKKENCTNKLFRILDTEPRVYSKAMLMMKKYPGIPSQAYYLVYRVEAVTEKELGGQSWDVSKLPGYGIRRRAAFPFVVPLAELLR